MSREFEAPELHADGSVKIARYSFEPRDDAGWKVRREGQTQFDLGTGYRRLEVLACGVCATDLARTFLPFPLPQVIGHEVVLRDDEGRRYVAEINASCFARGLEQLCPRCEMGLETHCQERMTLGIDRLPGGFGPEVLVPHGALLEVPESLPDDTAVLTEPFAAALHAVESIKIRSGESIGVLGPRRLGMLVVAALAAWREEHGVEFQIVALPRRAELGDLALRMGADRVELSSSALSASLDVIVDTTGSPLGLEDALRIARREVHLKSTHGREAGGLARLTELVVDELRLRPSDEDERDQRESLAEGRPARRARLINASVEKAESVSCPFGWESAPILDWSPDCPLPIDEDTQYDAVLVTDESSIDAAIRPRGAAEPSLIRPRGSIVLAPGGSFRGFVAKTVAGTARDEGSGLTLSASRCGSFARALNLLDRSPRFRELGTEFVTHRFRQAELGEALRFAATPECVKAVVRP